MDIKDQYMADKIIIALKEHNISMIADNRYPNQLSDVSKKQFTIYKMNGTYNVGTGPVFGEGEFIFNQNEAIEKLILNIITISNNIRSYLLVIPTKAVESCEVYVREGLIVRYLKDYLPNSDVFLERWDILISNIEMENINDKT